MKWLDPATADWICKIRKNASKKFGVKYGVKCTRTFEILTVAFGVSTMSGTQVQLCEKMSTSLMLCVLILYVSSAGPTA